MVIIVTTIINSMNSSKHIGPILSAVVPIALMANQLNLLEAWVKECKGKSIEILLMHDLYDEATSHELRELVANNLESNIIILEDKFGSPGQARNVGIQLATGEWIAFWDSDDMPNIEIVLEILHKESLHRELDVIIGQYKVFDISKNILINKTQFDSSLNDVALNPGVWRMLFRRSSIGDVRFPQFKMAEDQNFLSTLSLPEKNYRFTNSIFYTYYVGNFGQLTSQISAVNEILDGARFTFTKLKNSNVAAREFNLILFSRQITTGVKKGSFHVKIGCLFLLFKAITENNGTFAIAIIRVTLSIFLKSRRRKLT